MIRKLLRTVDFLPLFYGFGLVSMLLSKRFQRLGDMAAGTLASLQNRRALVILITNTRNEDERDHFAATNQLRHRHLVVLADLREEILDQTVTSPIDTESQALRYHAVEHYLDERRRKHRLLMHRGIRALDITARQLPVALVNQYLDIKAEASL